MTTLVLQFLSMTTYRRAGDSRAARGCGLVFAMATLICAACSGCHGDGRLVDAGHGQPRACAGFSDPQISGPLAFAAAFSDKGGELHLMLCITNRGDEDVMIPRKPDDYRGTFRTVHEDPSWFHGFFGGMRTRLMIDAYEAPVVTAKDTVTLSPGDSTAMWISIGNEEEVAAMEDVRLTYEQHAIPGLPGPTFSGPISFATVPRYEGAALEMVGEPAERPR